MKLYGWLGQDNNLFQDPAHGKRQGRGGELCQSEHQVPSDSL